ncbi:hypothetical protein [Promicromonospora soli]|uniref:Peptidase inhibitor family I36 n=1 Tax=Promicromonospora soli TaxID=2035533 RepID=A0A919G3G6_9MICO|nr:hypothetical protein [Promicromonospora soli]GHH76470.1 hypothetical protein GCM10017772_35210 [Promicromonospora soli]
MRKISILLATLGLVVTGALFPVASAQASAACDTAWNAATPGRFGAFEDIHCAGVLGSDADDDPNWADSVGSFQGSDNDKASSLLHKGNSGLAVRVWSDANYRGNFGCITKDEKYVSDLHDNYLTGGTDKFRAWDSISSHEWVSEAYCYGAFLS